MTSFLYSLIAPIIVGLLIVLVAYIAIYIKTKRMPWICYFKSHKWQTDTVPQRDLTNVKITYCKRCLELTGQGISK